MFRPLILAANTSIPRFARAYHQPASQKQFTSSYGKIRENAPAYSAVVQFYHSDIGCLVVVDRDNRVVGYITEHDYMTKLAFWGKSDLTVLVKDVCTYHHRLLVRKDDSLNTYVDKMMSSPTGHLFVMDHGNVTNVVSYKDVMQKMKTTHDQAMTRLTNFHMGKGAFFGSE